MTHWTERTYYSLDVDCEVARISGFDERCQEHWELVETGRGYRDRRNMAVQRIMASIEAGDEPGQVGADESEDA